MTLFLCALQLCAGNERILSLNGMPIKRIKRERRIYSLECLVVVVIGGHDRDLYFDRSFNGGAW